MKTVLPYSRYLVVAMGVAVIGFVHARLNAQHLLGNGRENIVIGIAGLAAAFLLWLLLDFLRSHGRVNAVRTLRLAFIALMLPFAVQAAARPGGLFLLVLVLVGLGKVLAAGPGQRKPGP